MVESVSPPFSGKQDGQPLQLLSNCSESQMHISEFGKNVIFQTVSEARDEQQTRTTHCYY